MSNVITDLMSGGPVLTDGAWGTQLQSLGLAIGDCPDAWNIRHPERVEQVARSYVEAGSKVILTNTFGASRIALQRHGLAEQAAEITRAGVEISRRAAGDSARVFASIGPTGKMMAAGEMTEAEALEAFREQTRAIRAGGAHGVVVETMTDLNEALLAVRATIELDIPVVACMTFDSGKDGARTMMGVSAEQAGEAFAVEGALAVGANCGKGPDGMVAICRILATVSGLPIWMKPNAGLPELVDGQAVYRSGPEEFSAGALALVDAGAAFIGGCCGTGPEHIRALAAAFAVRKQ